MDWRRSSGGVVGSAYRLALCKEKFSLNAGTVKRSGKLFEFMARRRFLERGLGALSLTGVCAGVRPSNTEAADPAPFPVTELDRLAKRFAGRVGFFVKDLRGGAAYGWHADQRFPPASVIKLSVMIELYRQAAMGRVDLDQKRPMPANISTHGSGELARRDEPIELALREYCRLMIVSSDNMATDLLIRTVGLRAVNRWLADQGLTGSRLAMEIGRWHYAIVGMQHEPISRANDRRQLARVKAGRFDDDGVGFSDLINNNVASPRDMATLLERLHGGRLAGERATRQMLDLLTASTHKQTIARYLRPEVRVANKYGSSRRIAGDAAIVYLASGPVAIAGFTLADAGGDRSGRELLARMSRQAVSALDPKAVQERAR